MSIAGKKIKIGIIGLGMVGEPIKSWFEQCLKYRRNKELFCYDIDPKKNYDDDFNRADIIFVSVPTPSNPDGSCNTSIIFDAVKRINDGKIVVVKSTTEPGTVEELQKNFPRKKFIFNPEFLTESQAWLDFIKPDRQIIGHTAKSYNVAREILAIMPRAHFERPWSSDYTKKSVNATEAEVAKYASNVFGYIKVIYGNILADICHALERIFKKDSRDIDVNYENVREIISADPRIGPAWLNVEHGDYCGAGGYCFPKDMKAFISFAKKLAGKLGKPSTSGKYVGDADGLIASIKNGIKVLEAIQTYNQTLLKWQGLTLGEVSRHDKDLIVNKRRKIRHHEKK